MTTLPRPMLVRFEEKVQQELSGECHLWIPAGDRNQYGSFWAKDLCTPACTVPAHRASWMIYRGTIPAGLSVLHRCGRKSCVNPEHLYLGTQVENMQDAIRLGELRPATGSRNGRSKLTPETVTVAFISMQTGASQAWVSRTLGVSESVILQARQRRSWKQVPPCPSTSS